VSDKTANQSRRHANLIITDYMCGMVQSEGRQQSRG
jgi:hypothetical protein